MPAPARHASAARNARLFASACLAVAGLALGATGCDSESGEADREAQKNIQAAQAERGEGAIKAGLDAAAKVPNASPAQAAQAKALLAQAQVEQAQYILRELSADEMAIARLVSEITDLAGTVAANNTAVAGFSKVAPEGTQALAKTLEGTRTQVQGKGGDAVWKLAGNAGQLPALSSVTERAKKLAPQIKDLEAKKAKLAKDRAAADAKAASLMQQSRRQPGKKSVDLFEQSTKESARSALTAKEIAGIDHQLMKLRQDEELAKNQAAQLDAAVKGFSGRITETKESQAKLQKLIEDYRALSQALVHGDGSASQPAAPAGGDKGDTATPPPGAAPAEGAAAEPAAFQEPGAAPATAAEAAAPPADAAAAEPAPEAAPATEAAPAEEAAPAARSTGGRTAAADTAGIDAAAAQVPPSPVITNSSMAAKARELSALIARVATQRKAALDLLTSATANYDSALQDAQRLRSDIQKTRSESGGGAALPQNGAWKALEEMFSPARLNLQKANVLHLIASLRRDEAASLAARARMLQTVRQVLGEAGIDMLPALDEPKVDAELQVATATATEAYDVTLKTLQTDVIEAAGGSDLEAASRDAAQVALVVAQYGRAQLAAALNQEQEAKRLMDDARRTVTNGPMQTDQYPAFVRRTLGLQVAPAAAPTTGPAGAGVTTAPADAAAPAGAAPADGGAAPTLPGGTPTPPAGDAPPVAPPEGATPPVEPGAEAGAETAAPPGTVPPTPAPAPGAQ